MLTQSELKSILHYNPDTGIFTWKVKTRNTNIGDVAGWSKDGHYARLGINGKLYLQHRLAFLYVYGYSPTQVDHTNQIKNDNRIVNLREVSFSENMKNLPRRKDNSSGITGVYWCKRDKAFLSQIRIDGKQIALYYGRDKEKAICARKEAEIKYGFSENHGR